MAAKYVETYVYWQRLFSSQFIERKYQSAMNIMALVKVELGKLS